MAQYRPYLTHKGKNKERRKCEYEEVWETLSLLFTGAGNGFVQCIGWLCCICVGIRDCGFCKRIQKDSNSSDVPEEETEADAEKSENEDDDKSDESPADEKDGESSENTAEDTSEDKNAGDVVEDEKEEESVPDEAELTEVPEEAKEQEELSDAYENYVYGDPSYSGNYVIGTDADGNDIYEMYSEDIAEIISMAEEGMVLERFFSGTIFAGFDLDDLRQMQEDGLSFELYCKYVPERQGIT